MHVLCKRRERSFTPNRSREREERRVARYGVACESVARRGGMAGVQPPFKKEYYFIILSINNPNNK